MHHPPLPVEEQQRQYESISSSRRRRPGQTPGPYEYQNQVLGQLPEQRNTGYAGGIQSPPNAVAPLLPSDTAGARVDPRNEAITAVEKLLLPKHSSGYHHVTVDESAMREMVE